MQAISVSEARQNFKKYCDDIVENNDVIIVSRSGNGRENMVWVNLSMYNELQKAKENLEDMMKIEDDEEDEKIILRPIEQIEEIGGMEDE